MHEKMEIEERRKQKKIDDKEDLTYEIIYYGLRQSYDQVDSALEKIPTQCEKDQGPKGPVTLPPAGSRANFT